MDFNVKENESETKVDILTIDASIDDSYLPEIGPLVEKCTEVNEPDKFFSQFETFLQLHHERLQYFKEKLIEVDINRNTGEYRVTFIPEGSTNPLARLTWKISYQTSNDTFLPSYTVGLTTEGL